jgi:hypothetical protein
MQSLFIKKNSFPRAKLNPIIYREGKQQVLSTTIATQIEAALLFSLIKICAERVLCVLMITHEKNNQPVLRLRARFSHDSKFPRQNQTKTRK